MTNALNFKLLLVAVALLASIASYFAYEKHKQEVEQQRTEEMLRRAQAEQKKQQPQNWTKPLRDYRMK